MNCKEVQESLVYYLEQEIDPGLRPAIRQHLAGCSACQQELAALAATRKETAQALQGLATQAQPSPEAWVRLQARLAKEARPSPSTTKPQSSRLAPGADRSHTQRFKGVSTMRKRFVLPALIAVVAIAILAVFMAKSATPVSAQQILERAYAAQTGATITEGIRHIRVESSQNLQAEPGVQAGIHTVAESYHDLASGSIRTVVTDLDSGRVLSVFGYDGTNTYSSKEVYDPNNNGPLTVYRTTQQIDKVADLQRGELADQAQQMFDQFRSDPNVEIQGPQAWTDGHQVYILRSHQEVKVLADKNVALPDGIAEMIFDAATYQLLESQSTFQKSGQEITVSHQKYLANEILPAGSRVAWDMSDLQGVKLIDDPQGKLGDLLPEKISPQDLAAYAQSPYVLGHVPDGFSQEITAPPQQAGGRYIYIIAYRNAAGDYFVIQDSGEATEQMLSGYTDDTYITASGLVLHFSKTEQTPDGKQYVEAVVQKPDGSSFVITSTLSKERVEKLAEDLVKSVG